MLLLFITARNPFFYLLKPPIVSFSKVHFKKIEIDSNGLLRVYYNKVELHILIHYGLISFPNRFVFENPRFALSLRESSYKSARNVSKANLFSEIT